MTAAKLINGARFGRLTVLRRAGTNERGCATWVCRCDCGELALRSGATLRASINLGCSSQCKTCCARDSKVRGTHGRSFARAAFRQMWTDHKSLYSAESEESLVRVTRDALERRFGPALDDVGALEPQPAEGVPTMARPGAAMTHKEIGDLMGVSPQCVQQIEKRALGKIRRALMRADLAFDMRGHS